MIETLALVFLGFLAVSSMVLMALMLCLLFSEIRKP